MPTITAPVISIPATDGPGVDAPEYDQIKSERFSSIGSEWSGSVKVSSFKGNILELSSICSEENPFPQTSTRVSSPPLTSSLFRSFQGILMALLSSLFFSLTSVIVKDLKYISAGQMACFRFVGIFIFTIPMVITAEENPFGPKDKRVLLIMRGIAGASSLFLRYSALHYMPIANATVIILSMPVFVSIFGRIFLKEPCGLFHVVTITITLVGIAITSKLNMILGFGSEEDTDEKHNQLIGLAYSMGATIVGATVYIFVRKVKECHSSVILFNFALVSIVESAILTYAIDDQIPFVELPPLDSYVPWLLMSIGILSFYGQLLLTKAIQVEEASLISVTRVSGELTCAFIFQIIIFKQTPDVYTIIGSILVSTSVLLTSARKWVSTLRPGHWGRKYLGFTLK